MKLTRKLTALCLMLGMMSCGSNTTKEMETEFTDCVTAALANDGEIDLNLLEWTREPAAFTITEDEITDHGYDTRLTGGQADFLCTASDCSKYAAAPV